MKSVRVVLADHHEQYLDSLQAFLREQDDIQVIFVTHDGQGAVDACNDMLPDVVLLDLRLPVLDGVRATRSIVALHTQTQVLGTSAVPQDHYAVEAIKAGARGYVRKNGPDSFQQIANAIRQIAAGEVVLDADLATYILNEFS
jgi:DNA-binding NarL/FixJ family response regulator